MAMQLPAAAGDARSEPATRTALVLEMVALRHQIAVLKRSGTTILAVANNDHASYRNHFAMPTLTGDKERNRCIVADHQRSS